MSENRIITGIREEGKRLLYNDFAKSLGMLMILWGHIRLDDWSNAFVYSFHIPLFFVLSGMVFSKDRCPKFIPYFKKIVKSLLVPDILFSILTWCVWAIYSYVTNASIDSYSMPLLQTFFAQGSGGFLMHNVPLWFVTCLFVMEIMYFFIVKLNKSLIFFVTICLAALSYSFINFCSAFDFTLLPWNIEVAMLGIPFYALGNLAVSKWGHQGMIDFVNSHKSLSWFLIVVFAVLGIIGSTYNGSISFGHADLGRNVFVSYICAILGICMLLMLCMLLGGVSAKIKGQKWYNALLWFGRNSFYAMCIHNPIKGFVIVVVGKIIHCRSQDVNLNSYYSLIAFFFTLIATILGIIFINWFKRRFLIRR